MNKLFSLITAFILWLFFPKRQERPNISNLVDARDENLPDDQLNLGNIYIGAPRSGKTTALARHRGEYDLKHLDHASFALDASGSYIDDYLAYAQTFPRTKWESLKEKLTYIRLGDPNWVVPTPEFSPEHGSTFEEQTNRVIKNVRNLTFHQEREVHILGGAAIWPNLLDLLICLAKITPHHEPFQITDAPAIIDYPNNLKAALDKCGHDLNFLTREFFETRFLDVAKGEGEIRSYSLHNIFSFLTSKDARATLGYYRPLWTVKEAIEKGNKVLIDGSRLANQQDLLNYLFTQYFSLIMEQLNKRHPHDEGDKPVALIIDEFPKFTKTPGLAEEIEQGSPLYRSRLLQLYLVIQGMSQLSVDLQETIWLLLNRVCFSLSNKENDARRVAYELFHYDPQLEKLPAAADNQNQVSEPEKGQDRQNADWLTSLAPRTCIVKTANSDKVMFIAKTKEVPPLPPRPELEALKNELLANIAISKTEALAVANSRIRLLSETNQGPNQVRGGSLNFTN